MFESNLAKLKDWRADRGSRRVFLAIFLLLILAAWVVLIAWNQHHTSLSGINGQVAYLLLNPSYLVQLCSTPDRASVWEHVSMWGLMSTAMMLPTAAPTVSAYLTFAVTYPSAVDTRHAWALIGGFMAVWLIFSAGAGAVQWELTRFGLLTTHGTSLSAPLSTALLIVAGLYQFSPIKAACVSRCRSPMTFFISAWRDGMAGAFRMGFRNGLDCLGCCWALMLLAFVGGTMNLIWMGIATVLMVFEKLPSIGHVVTKPLGAVLIGCALYLAWINFTAT